MNHKPRPVLTGRKPVLEALQQGRSIDKLFLLRTATGEEIQQIRKLSRELNIPLSLVPAEKLNQLSRIQHQGVVALVSELEYLDLQDALSFVVEKGEVPFFLLLDGITDVRNVGAIARTALCCGIHGLILPVSNSAMLTDEAVKTSAGALNQIMLCRTPSVEQAVDTLRLNGIRILGAEMKGSVPVYEADFRGPVAIVLGAEGKGVSRDIIRRADQLIRIPMAGTFDSLNVSVAAGMILYEAIRQKGF